MNESEKNSCLNMISKMKIKNNMGLYALFPKLWISRLENEYLLFGKVKRKISRSLIWNLIEIIYQII